MTSSKSDDTLSNEVVSALSVVVRHLRAVELGDPDVMASDYAEEAVLLRDREYRGRDAIRQYFETVASRLGEGRVVFESVEATESLKGVRVRWRIEGAPRRASGKDKLVVAGGYIVEQRVELDVDDF